MDTLEKFNRFVSRHPHPHYGFAKPHLGRRKFLQMAAGGVGAAFLERRLQLLNEQALAADLRQPSVLHRIAGGGDGVLLEHIHPAQHRAECRQQFQEAPRLHQSKRGTPGPDPQRQGTPVRFDGRGRG